MNKDRAGFTIVELLIVIVVIGILAAITIVSYRGIQERATFTSLKSDLRSLNTAVQLYHANTGSYPSTNDAWSGDNQTINDSFIPGLVPAYISKTPQVPSHSGVRPTFLYRSNGTGYKLLYILNNGETLPTSHTTDNPLLDPARLTRAWGYFTEDYRPL